MHTKCYFVQKRLKKWFKNINKAKKMLYLCTKVGHKSNYRYTL